MGNIAVMIHSFAGGGAERVAANLINCLVEDNRVCAITFNKPSKDEYPLDERVERHVFRLAPEKPGESRRKAAWRRWRAIRAFRRKSRFDVVISFLEQGNFLNMVTSVGEKTIVSIRNHTSSKIRLLNPPKELIRNKRFDCLASAVVCVSEDVAEDAIANFGIPRKKVRVIPNWVDADKLRALSGEEARSDAFTAFEKAYPFIFATAGRLVSQKGQWHLIRAFSEVHRVHPEAGLLILGGGGSLGSVEDGLMAEIQRSGAADAIFMAGKQENPFAWEARSKVFVLPSLFEGMSNAVFEAMALGLPIIADDCAGIREQLTPSRTFGSSCEDVIFGEYGAVTPLLSEDWPDNPELTPPEEALARAMLAFIENDAMREDYSARSMIRVKDFTREIVMAKWEALIEELRGHRG